MSCHRACIILLAMLLPSLAGGVDGVLLKLKPATSPQILTLRDALGKIENGNKDVLTAKEQLEQKSAQVRRAFAGYLPKIDLSGVLTLNYPKVTLPVGSQKQNFEQATLYERVADLLSLTQNLRTDSVDSQSALASAKEFNAVATQLRNAKEQLVVVQPTSVFDAKLTLSQPIVNLSAYAQISTASLDRQRSENTLKQARATAAIDVVRAYLQAVKTRHLVHIAEDQRNRAKEQLKNVQAKYHRALMRNIDVHRLALELHERQTEVVTAHETASTALGVLGMLIGEEQVFALEERPAIKNTDALYCVDVLVGQALGNREDVQAQQKAVAMAEESIKAAYYAFAPSFDVVGQGQFTSNTSGFINKPWRAAVMFQANWPLFDGGDRYGRMRESKSKSREEKVKLVDFQRHVEAEVRGKLSDVETKRLALDSARRSLELQQQIDHEINSTFQTGLSDVMDLIDANHQLAQKQIAVENARIDLVVAEAELAYSTGHIFDAIKTEG